GFGVYEALRYRFDLIISIEIMEAEVERLKQAFAGDPRIHLLAGESPAVLRHILPQIQTPICFWLDAHFPGAHHKLKLYEAVQEDDIRLPLERELEVIKELRPQGKDVILIDDLRIYEKDNWEWGNLDKAGLEHIARYDSKFIYTMFEQTHVVNRFLSHSG